MNDLAHLTSAVGRNRLVVVTGPGGVGKTRLALEVAHRLAGQFRDGVAVTELGPVTPGGEESVRRAVAAAVDNRRTDESRAYSRGGAGPETRQLLVIDNAEHVLDPATAVTTQLLAEQAGLHILMTSRRPPTGVPAHVWEVGPLGVQPADRGDAATAPAVELFLRRANASCPTLDLDSRPQDVIELCQRLEGLPLAIELAAHRIRSVSLDTLLADAPISQLLGDANPGGLPHQRNLSESVRWSYELLGERQRGLLHHLARLFDRFTIEDVRRVPPLPGLSKGAFVGVLSELVDSSLIQVRRGSRYQYRFFGFVRDFLNGLRPVPVPPR